MGGTVGGWIGVTDGGTMGQMVGAQIGGMSIALEHIGCTEPFMHRHTQFALAGETEPVPVTMPNATTKAHLPMASPGSIVFWKRIYRA